MFDDSSSAMAATSTDERSIMAIRIDECDHRVEATNEAFLGAQEPTTDTVRNVIGIREKAERSKEKIYAEHGMDEFSGEDGMDMTDRFLSRTKADSLHGLSQSLGDSTDYYHLPPEQAVTLAEIIYSARESGRLDLNKVTLGAEVALRNLLGRGNWLTIKGMETDPDHAFYNRADLRFSKVKAVEAFKKIPQRTPETDEEERCLGPVHQAAEQLTGPLEPGTVYIVNFLREQSRSHQDLADLYVSRGQEEEFVESPWGGDLTNLGQERMSVESCNRLAGEAQDVADLSELAPWVRVDIARHLFDEAWIYLRDRENPPDVTGLELAMARLIGQGNWDKQKEQTESYWSQGLPHFGYVDTKKPLI